MSYDKITDAPDWVQKMGDAAARQWIAVFNAAFKQYGGDEQKAFAVAAAAVNRRKAERRTAERGAAFVRMASEFRLIEAFPETFEGTKVRVQLFPIGHWEGHDDGAMDIAREHLETAMQNFERTGRACAVDFDHGLDYGRTPEERRAAGWIRSLDLTDQGLFAEFDATEEAAQWIRSGAYRFISPTFAYSFTDKETGEDQGFTLLRAGLTNTPWFDGMVPCVAMNEHTRDVGKKAMEALNGKKSDVVPRDPPVIVNILKEERERRVREWEDQILGREGIHG